MKLFEATFDVILIRFYLMMGVVFVGVFSGMYAIAGLALPIFLSAILGVSFKKTIKESAQSLRTTNNNIELNTAGRLAA